MAVLHAVRVRRDPTQKPSLFNDQSLPLFNCPRHLTWNSQRPLASVSIDPILRIIQPEAAWISHNLCQPSSTTQRCNNMFYLVVISSRVVNVIVGRGGRNGNGNVNEVAIDLKQYSFMSNPANYYCTSLSFSISARMGSWKLVSLVLLFLSCSAALSSAADPGNSSTGFSFKDSFKIMPAQDHFRTSPDGQIWYLFLDKKTGGGFQTRARYLFGWFSMKMKLVGGDSSGVVTAYYMCSDLGAGPKRDELDFEFLGNRTGQPYTIQTNVYQSGIGGREMRHSLWFDPTADFHTYSILWNSHRIVFYADRVPIRVYKNNGRKNDFFPTEKPMYMFSSIWNGDDWATRGGLEKTDWKKAPFVSSYKDFNADGCRWEEPFPACVASTGEHWWDQSEAWVLADAQQEDFSWVGRNLVVYDYCKDTERYPELPEECNL